MGPFSFKFCLLMIIYSIDNTNASSSTMRTTLSSFDPCTSYASLNNHKRSTAYQRGTTAICDSAITEQWYRSVSGAGSDMPTTTVPMRRCGTQYPIWINDTFPNIMMEKEVVACISHIFGSCHQDFKIKMKNCSEFNVYYLTQTSGCPVAYCFGDELPCPVYQTSSNGFSPGCYNITKYEDFFCQHLQKIIIT